MAFTIETKRESRGIVRVVTIGIALLLLGSATFYLFFTEPPQIEVFVPPELQTISQISGEAPDPSAVINSPVYQSLQEHVGPPQLGEFGRENPFARF